REVVPKKKEDGVDELKQFLKKKKIENNILKKLIDKQEIDLLNQKNKQDED
ncbi:MAG: hypothetical protein GQ527_04950, partial [Bacteroidales bacterium]|nr:hypothetical protein [Bacteroidales bacterium]